MTIPRRIAGSGEPDERLCGVHTGTNLIRKVLVPAWLVSAGVLAGTPLRAQAPPATGDTLKVVLLGTGVGPRVDLRQYGASTLIEAGPERLLVDCGRGATLRLAQAGVPIGSISRLFLTHLHSDHVIQIPDLLLTGWAGGRAVPLEVWGPDGTRAMMDHLQQAFAFDIGVRRDRDEHFAGASIRVRSHDIGEGVVYDRNGVTVTAFLVEHGPVRPAFGYRIDYHGHSVVLSGDTRMSEAVVRMARGVDVLVHEAIDPDLLHNRPDRPSPAVVEAIVAHHTTPEQAGEVFARAAPRLAVYAHAPSSEHVIAATRKTYRGPLEGAQDLTTIVISDRIEVRH